MGKELFLEVFSRFSVFQSVQPHLEKNTHSSSERVPVLLHEQELN
jgi:hypothetical protein